MENMAGLKTFSGTRLTWYFLFGWEFSIVILAFVLACGVLLSILSCALYQNWYPLIIIATYLSASLPNPICGRCSSSDDLLSDSSNSGFADAGRFLTSVFMVSGFGLPLVFSHAEIISPSAAALSTVGGILIYSSVFLYGYFFAVEEEF